MNASRQILLVDSSPPDRGILRNRLTDAGHSVQEEADWNRGLELASEHTWDAIVVASRSEGVLLGKLMSQLTKGFPGRPYLSLVVYEARQGAQDADLPQAFEAGCDAFVQRAELPALVSVLEGLMSQRHHLREIHANHRNLAHHKKVLEEAPVGAPPNGATGGLQAVMIADSDGMVLASDAGAGRLTGGSPVGSALASALPQLDTERLVSRTRVCPMVSEPFEQPGNLGPAGSPLELNVVSLLSAEDATPLKLALVTQQSNGNKYMPTGATSQWNLEHQVGLDKAATQRLGLSSFLGRSPLVNGLRETALQAANSTAPFLIIGSQGSGARTLAKAIHCTANPLAPLEQLKAGSLPSQWVLDTLAAKKEPGPLGLGKRALNQSESQTDAQRTFLLSQVDRLSQEEQATLADMLPCGRLILTSSASPRSLHPRLAAAIGDNFVVVPSLRERMEDVPLLANHFVSSLGQGSQMTDEAVQSLLGYPWPGNVAELESCLRSAHIAARIETFRGNPVLIGREHLPESILNYRFHGAPAVGGKNGSELRPWDITDSDDISFDLYEKKVILRALDHCKGNRLACARFLRLGKSTLYRKLKRLGIDTGE